MTHLAIIPGHGHRQDRRGRYRFDPGAVWGDLRESDFARDLAGALYSVRPDDCSVHDSPPHGPWTYTSRRNAAHQAIGDGPGIVLHGHVNSMPAGKAHPDLVQMYYDPRSVLGATLADRWATVAESILGRPCRAVAAIRKHYPGAANLIEPTYAATGPKVCALLLEAAFIGNPIHQRRLLTPSGRDLHVAALIAAFLEGGPSGF